MCDTVIIGTKDFQVPEYFNFADVIDEWAQKEKEGERKNDTPALWWIDGEGSEVKWSFQDVAFQSKKAANVLSSSVGIKPGDRVMAILPRIPEYFLMQTACLRTGAVYLITNPYVGPKELQRRIEFAKPACVVVSACKEVSSQLLDVVDQFVSSGKVNIKGRILVNRWNNVKREGWLSLDQVCERTSADYQSVKSLSSAPCLLLFTSGTAGNAKMVEHSHASLGLRGASMRIPRFEETDFIWTASSPGWIWLLEDGVFCAWSVGSGSFLHYKNVTSREALEVLGRYPITQAGFRNLIYMKALEEEDLKSFRFLKLKRCFCGGQPVNRQMVKKWNEQTGIELWDTYGQTETGYLTFPREPGDDKHVGSAGKAFPGVDLLIVDDKNIEVPDGTLGKIVVRVKPYRPVNLFNRYVDEPEKTAACFSDDLYITGDLGHRDADGHFWISGRADDMIISNAINVNPYEVETCLKEHPAVMDCAVVGVPAEGGDEMVKAFVVLSKDFRTKNHDELKKELKDHVRYNTGEWMCPKKVEFIDDLPKTLSGKTNRRELRNKELIKH